MGRKANTLRPSMLRTRGRWGLNGAAYQQIKPPVKPISASKARARPKFKQQSRVETPAAYVRQMAFAEWLHVRPSFAPATNRRQHRSRSACESKTRLAGNIQKASVPIASLSANSSPFLTLVTAAIIINYPKKNECSSRGATLILRGRDEAAPRVSKYFRDVAAASNPKCVRCLHELGDRAVIILAVVNCVRLWKAVATLLSKTTKHVL